MKWRLVAGGLTVLLMLAGCGGPEEEPAPVLVPGRPGEPARTLAPGETNPVPVAPPNDQDRRYVQNMIIHHAQALEMTALAPERAAAPNVKGIADRISASQQAEIDAMNNWLSGHGQPTVDPKHTDHGAHAGMPGMATAAQLDALRAARGADFDKLFVQLMITHHEGAVTMSHEVQTSGVDVLVQELADDVIATQSDEINRLRGM